MQPSLQTSTPTALIAPRQIGRVRRAEPLSVRRPVSVHMICAEEDCPHRGACLESRCCAFRLERMDESEAIAIAETAARMDLQHVVLVGGDRSPIHAGLRGWSACIREVRRRLPLARLELQTPDFRGRQSAALAALTPLAPFVWAHAIGPVPRLHATRAPGADYQASIELLLCAGHMPGVATRSWLELGHGETLDEVLTVLDDLASIGVSRLAIGQYERRRAGDPPVAEYVHPRTFQWLAGEARARGIAWVAASPSARPTLRASLTPAETLHFHVTTPEAATA